MKKLFMSLILTGCAFSVSSQDNSEKPKVKKVELPMLCMSAANAEAFVKQHKESAVFAGLDKLHSVENLTLNIFRNENTKSFTVVFLALDKDMVCILSAGEGSNFLYKY